MVTRTVRTPDGWLQIETTAGGTKIVRAATDANLPANTQFGSTLVADAFGALPAVDGVALVLLDSVLVKNPVADARNGIYIVTDLGSATTPWILTRRDDADTGQELVAGTTIVPSEGAVNGDTLFELATDNPIIVGTTPLTFVALTVGVLTVEEETVPVQTSVVVLDVLGPTLLAAAAGAGRASITQTAAAPVTATGDTNTEGVSTSVARADHLHRLGLLVRDAGGDVGVRPFLRFLGAGVTVADDAGDDEVEVTIPFTPTPTLAAVMVVGNVTPGGAVDLDIAVGDDINYLVGAGGAAELNWNNGTNARQGSVRYSDTDNRMDFRVVNADEMRLTTALLGPRLTPGGLNLGTIGVPWGTAFLQDAAIAGAAIADADAGAADLVIGDQSADAGITINMGGNTGELAWASVANQRECAIEYDGARLLIRVNNTNEFILNNTEARPVVSGGLNLGLAATRWGDVFSDGFVDFAEVASIAAPAAGAGRMGVLNTAPNLAAFVDDAGTTLPMSNAIEPSAGTITAGNRRTIMADGALATVDIDLPTAEAGLEYTIIVLDVSNAVTVVRGVGDNINGVAADKALGAIGRYFITAEDATDWWLHGPVAQVT